MGVSTGNVVARQHGAMEFSESPVDLHVVRSYRLERIREQLRRHDYAGILLFDQVNCRYACDATNMQIWCSHYEARCVFVATDGPIHRAFTIGRVRFVMTDTRSERTDSTMLGAEQRDWLVEELATAAADHALVVWVNPTPWIGEPSRSSDHWAGWDGERAVIEAYRSVDSRG